MRCCEVTAKLVLFAWSQTSCNTRCTAGSNAATKPAVVVKRGGKSNVTVDPKFAWILSKSLNLVFAVEICAHKFNNKPKDDLWYVWTCCKMLFGNTAIVIS